jgi:hypothetical protein
MKTDREIIELLEWTGHLQYPFGKYVGTITADDIGLLSLTDPVVKEAIRSYQDLLVVSLEPLALRHHGRSVCCDGDCGIATRELFEQPRCGCPDYGPQVQPAVGTGSWKRCHSIGDFHAATVYVHESGMASWLKPKFDEVWKLTVAAYEALGLRWIRTDNRNANIDFSFVTGSRGWIGLAIVGSGQSCGSQIWCKYLASWRPSNVVREWAILVMHELGHNAGLYHTRGGVMNAGIIYGLPASWAGDPAESILKRYYGGQPIEPEPPVPPPPPPPPPGPEDEEYGSLKMFREGKWKDFDVLERAKV